MGERQYEPRADCPICNHPEREQIDAELAAMHRGGIGMQGVIARRYGPENTLTTLDVLTHDRHRRAEPKVAGQAGQELRYGALYAQQNRDNR